MRGEILEREAVGGLVRETSLGLEPRKPRCISCICDVQAMTAGWLGLEVKGSCRNSTSVCTLMVRFCSLALSKLRLWKSQVNSSSEI